MPLASSALPAAPAGEPATGEWSADDRAALLRAKRLLETPGFVAALAGLLGEPVERVTKVLPRAWQERIARASQAALMQALALAVRSLGPDAAATGRAEGAEGGEGGEGLEVSERALGGGRRARPWLDRALVSVSGGVGGALGPLALPLELPLSTALMLRSIADIARSEGADLSSLETRLACLEVLALGGAAADDDAAETSYWTTRTAMAQLIGEAVGHLGRHGLGSGGAPVLVRFVNAIAARFGVVVGEQLAAKALPLVGALGGGAVNYLFMSHFQQMARGHFIVRRLEARYGQEAVRRAYAALEA